MMAFKKYFAKFSTAFLILAFLSGCQGFKYVPKPSSGGGVYHTVEEGQTLFGIAKAYDVDVETLLRANSIDDPAKLPVGIQLWIPGAKGAAEVASAGSAGGGKNLKRYVRGKPFRGFLNWPAEGTVTSPFGYRSGKYHDGIDIGAKEGAPILAAADGKVMFSGWGPTGYGMIVIVKHANHLTTLYAHSSKNLVKKNARVKQGQKIAEVGQTGRATGPHLHFEVRNDTHPKDPLLYLPDK